MNTSKYLIRFFKVGKESKSGDAILIELYDNEDNPHLVLIDGGYKETGEIIVKYLTGRSKNKTILDYVINTHPDSDHISGLISLVSSDAVEVKEIILNRPWKDANIRRDYFKDKRITPKSLLARMRDEFSLLSELENLANTKGIIISSPCLGEVLYGGVIQILGPSKELYRKHLLLSDKTPETVFDSELNVAFIHKTYAEENYNDKSGVIEWFYDEETSNMNQTSVIVSLKLHDKQFLLTGDAGKEAINEALDFYENQSSYDGSLMCRATDFTHLQLPHHGSRKNIDPNILERIQAKTYIISCAPEGEKTHHPSRRLMNKILEIDKGAHIYRTGDSNFVFHKNVEVLATTATPQGISFRMDGRAI